ncbi:MAG: hypothetical protein HC824_08130 [Synechococcales cyanobacterium RM1_1_8]|nr:hypothetical protein [Synechococcales cyanobacterium RM1_1_8]
MYPLGLGFCAGRRPDWVAFWTVFWVAFWVAFGADALLAIAGILKLHCSKASSTPRLSLTAIAAHPSDILG